MNLKLVIYISLCYLHNLYVISAVLKHEAKENATNICLSQDCVETAGLITTSIDDTVDPCDDFYKYACGNWQKEHFVPTNASYSYSHFSKVHRLIKDRLAYKLKRGYQQGEPAVLKRLYNFYNSCVDFASREKAGLTHLRKLVELIGGWPVIDSNWTHENYEWENAFVTINHLIEISFPFSFQITTDKKNTSQNILMLSSPYTMFTNFGSNEYIKQEDPVDPRPKFKIFDADSDSSEKVAQAIKGSSLNHSDWVIETTNVNSFLNKLRNISSSINLHNGTIDKFFMDNYDDMLWSADKLRKTVPNINWDKIFLDLFGTTNITEKIFVMDVNFTAKVNDVIKKADKRTIANLFAMIVTMEFIPDTTEEYYKQFNKLPIDQLCFDYSSMIFNDLLSKLYLHEFKFDENSKANIKNMIDMITLSFGQLMDENTWMDPTTKKLAKEKLLAIHYNIGAPDIIFDDKGLEKQSTQYGDLNQNHLLNLISALNVKNTRKFNYLHENPNSDSIWPRGMDDARIVNAFYHIWRNDIFFPAGIIHTPFYSAKRPISANFGAVGVIIGHELTHGFDSIGSKYDINGVQRNWWTNETLKQFQAKNQCLVNQYSKFNITEVNKFVNGKDTLGENIADNGGIREAFRALQNYKKQVKSAIQKLPGDLADFSDEKIFFLSFAAQLCDNQDMKSILQQIKFDSHSPSIARVNVPLANFDEFSKAFNCPVDSRMNPKDKCIVW